jgi:NAD(P)-dependent dehydrogenase (short-subunit alcohol dehydrogenase family)
MITGAASGLGAATAQRFAEAGANVVIVDQDADRAEAFAATLGEKALAVAADVTSDEEMTAALAATQERFGGLHILVNCAGISLALRTTSKNGAHPLDVFETVIGINLIGTFNAIRLAAMLMARNEPNADGERGVIVNTASVAAFDGQVGQVAYAASKRRGRIGAAPRRDLERDAIRVCACSARPTRPRRASEASTCRWNRASRGNRRDTTLTGSDRLDGEPRRVK